MAGPFPGEILDLLDADGNPLESSPLDSGSPPPPVVVWSPGTINTEGHRFFSIDLKTATAGLSVTLRFRHTDGEDKSYTITSGASGVWTTRIIDLCQPDDMADDDDSLADGVYTQESRYPLRSGSTSQPDKSDATWGLNGFDTLTITGLEAGDEIDNLKLVADSYQLGSFMPSFRPFASGWAGTSQKPAWYSNTDGRVSDRPFFFLSGSTYSWHSITNALLEIAQASGWTVGAGGALPGDGYHTNSLEGFLLGGGGVSYNWGGGGSWVPWIDISFASAINVTAQALWDEIQGFPGIGDAWLGGSYGPSMKIRAAKVVRGHAWGLVFGQGSGEAESGMQVTLKTNPGLVSAGSGTTDALGHYQTGTPFAKFEDHKAYAGNLVSQPLMMFARTRRRLCWYINRVGEGCAVAIRSDWFIAAAKIREGEIVLQFGYEGQPLSEDIETNIAADAVSLAWLPGRDGELAILYTDAGEVSLISTSNEGGSYSMATVVASGPGNTFPALTITPDGVRHCYWINGGNAVLGRRYKSDLTPFGAASSARSPVDDAGLAVDSGRDAEGQVVIEMLTVEGGDVTLSRSVNGETFA